MNYSKYFTLGISILILSALMKIASVAYLHGRKAPGTFRSTVHKRAWVDTLAEKKLEIHPHIKMAWVEYDSTKHEWYAWVIADGIEVQKYYCDECVQFLHSDMIKTVEREINLK